MHVLFLYSRIDNCYRWTIGLIFLSTLKLLFWKSHVPLTFSSISVFEFHFYSVYCMQRMSTFGCMFIIMTLTVLEFFKTKNNIQFFFSTWRRNIIYQHSGATVPELFKSCICIEYLPGKDIIQHILLSDFQIYQRNCSTRKTL